MIDAINYGPASLNRSYGAPEIENQRRVTLERLAVREGHSVLDVGCGSGFLTVELAAAVGSHGRVIAVDKSEEMVDATRERCRGLAQVQSMTADVTALPMGDGSFDVVSCTQVLLYVRELHRALEGMVRVLRSGGRLAILETDWRGVVMASNYPETTAAVFRAWDDTVPSPNLPTRLLPMMRDAGLEDVEVTPVPILNTEFQPDAFSVSSLEWLTATARKRDAVTAGEARAWLDDLATLGEQGEYFFCVNRFLFVGHKS